MLQPPSAQSPFASWSVLPPRGRRRAPPRRALPLLLRSYGLMRQTCALLTPRVLPLCARSLQAAASPLLGTGPSRRYSANLFQRVWTHTTAASKVHVLVSSLGTLAFSTSELDRRLAFSQQPLQLGGYFRGCSHSLMFRPISLLATPVAPTLAPSGAGRPWLLLPRLSRLVACPVQRLC